MYWAGWGFVRLYMYEDGSEVPPDFEGGLYAVTTDIDQQTDKEQMDTGIDNFLSGNGFERDTPRSELGNVITSPRV